MGILGLLNRRIASPVACKSSLFTTNMVRVIDIGLTSMVLGQTIWVFFIQSGVLMKFLGREKFVPIMMKITKTFMKVNMYCLFGVLCTTSFIEINTNEGNKSIKDLVEYPLICAVFGLFCGCLNNFIVTPKALSVGAKTAFSNLC